jgi:hypothetical protein
MLDTVLQIGKTFRNSPDGLKYHRYIKSPIQQNDWEKITFISLPVKENISFDFNSIAYITDENLKHRLFYLTFKTSDADGLVKYFFGDIFYSLKDGNEGGYYRMPDLSNKQKAYRKGSFLRGDDDFNSIKEKIKNHKGIYLIEKFREEFRKNLILIERLLKFQAGFIEYFDSKSNFEKTPKEILEDENELMLLNANKTLKEIKKRRNAKKILDKLMIAGITWEEIRNDMSNVEKLNSFSTSSIFLHFDFSGKHWYEFPDELELVNEKLLDDFVEQSPNGEGFILKKYLYKTLSSPEKDFQFPRFSSQERYKNKIFNKKDDISDLIYAIDYSKTALIKIPNTNIKIIVLPKGTNLTAEDYDRFLGKDISIKEESEAEEIIKYANNLDVNSTIDKLFENITKDVNENITQFDLIFSKQGGQTNPDSDIIELAGIEKSFINYISTRIRKIATELFEERSRIIKSEKLGTFNIYRSFLNILGDMTKEKKKYQNHLYTVLPQIYSGTYYRDPILLPIFIEKTEEKIRNGEVYYNIFKYDFYFLTKIQNTLIEGENLMKILESPSYKLGLSLGIMARPFASWREDCPIKSFEKNYVGNLTRRIASLNDLLKLKVDIEQKLIMHEKTYPDIKEASLTLAEGVKSFKGRYDKNECAFGFFESYFAFSKKNENNS